MNWRDTFGTASDAVRTHRLRSALTMLGILIGIAAVILTVVLASVALVLATTLTLVFIGQKRLARRLLHAGHRLSDDIVPAGSGLAEATSVVERAVAGDIGLPSNCLDCSIQRLSWLR